MVESSLISSFLLLTMISSSFLPSLLLLPGMGQMGELGRSSSMGAPLTTTEEGIPQYDLGKMFIGQNYTTMERGKDGTMEEVEDYRYHTDLINELFLTPAPVEWHMPGNYDVLDVAVGECHMVVVAREDDGMTRVYSCGHNNYGQLGHGDRIQRHALTPIEELDGEEICQVACGTFHTLFLGTLGNLVFACGRSDYGQLGLFDEKEKEAGGFQLKPVPVPFPKEIGSTRIVSIAAGASNSACVADDGDVYTWGFNETASTGHPSKQRHKSFDIERATKLKPMRYYKKNEASMGTTATVSSVSLGGQHSLMVVQRYQ
jgi:alpha-tubulin suppressor-like RCC1 family protein